MTYIINPSWVYWLHVLDSVKIVAIILCVAGMIVTVILGIPIFIAVNEEDEESLHNLLKFLKIVAPFTGVCLLLAIFIPSQETMIMMKAAELATKENIQYTSKQLKELIDYIIMAVKTING